MENQFFVDSQALSPAALEQDHRPVGDPASRQSHVAAPLGMEVPGYDLTEWRGGQAWVQQEYPNLLFAEDGEIYEFDGKKAIAIGGAYSVDKFYRIAAGAPWFPTEQPDGYIKQRVEHTLERVDWRVDYVLSHTVPLSAMPRHAFLPTLNQSMVDNSTEKWLEKIQQKLTYERWFAGHFHVTYSLDRIRILFEDYDALKY